MADSSLKGEKTLSENEKLLVPSKFSFSHGVFQIIVLQTRKNQCLLCKGCKKKGAGITHVSLRSPRNLAWSKPFAFCVCVEGGGKMFILLYAKVHSTQGFSRLLDK